MRSNPRRRPRIAAAALITAAAALLAGPVPAQAATGTYLRLAHLSPDTPAVDVVVSSFSRPNWSIELDSVGYGAVSDYQRIEPGSYTVAMRPAGADPASDPVITATLQAAQGNAYTVAGLGRFAELALSVLTDDITLPPAGQARMRVINAAPRTGELDIRLGEAAVIEKAPFGQASDYTEVPAGQATLRVLPTGAPATDLGVNLQAGGVYSVLVLEKDGALSAVARQDAKGAEVVPAGGMETGLGGAAASGWSVSALVAALLAAGVVASGALTVRGARRRRAG